MKDKENIVLGASFSGIFSTIGCIMFVAGIFMYRTEIPVLTTHIFMIFSIIFIVSVEVVEIDYKQRRIRKIIHFLFIKFGNWEPLDDFDKLVLGANHDSFKLVSPAHPFFQKDVKLKSYDIYIFNSKNPEKTFLFMSFKNIPKAHKNLRIYAEKLNIEMRDTIQEAWDSVREREGRY